MRQLAFASAVIVALVSSAAVVHAETLDATDSGHYRDNGSHTTSNASNENYIAGQLVSSFYRNFFVFDLSGVTGTITAAEFHVDSATVGTAGTYTLYSVTHTVSEVTSVHSSSDSEGDNIYADLGEGATFGSITIAATDDNKVLKITLNSDAIFALNFNAGGDFVFGGNFVSSTVGGSTVGYAFGASPNIPDTRQLVLTMDPIPEPGTLALLGLGFAGLAAARRRRAV